MDRQRQGDIHVYVHIYVRTYVLGEEKHSVTPGEQYLVTDQSDSSAHCNTLQLTPRKPTALDARYL